MNYQNFNQAGGFPIKTQSLNDIQEAFSIFNQLGEIAGNFSIITGCVQTGNVVSDGFVFINGELLPFRGGQLGTSVIIGEEITQREFKNGQTKNVLYTRYATFGIAATVYPWANFKRSKNTQQLTELVALIPNKVDQTVYNLLVQRVTELESRPTYVNPVKNKGWFTLGDIAGGLSPGTQLQFSGDCTSAVIAQNMDGGNQYVEVTFSNAMPTVDYEVKLNVQSLGNISADNDASNPVWQIVSTNKFKVGIYEASQTTQAIRIHFEVIKIN